MKTRFFLSILSVLIMFSGLILTACGGPVELAISPISVTDITDSSAIINWTTSKPTTTYIQYGGTTAMTSSSPEGATLRIDHSFSLSELSANTKYYFKIKAVDRDENEVTTERAWFSTKTNGTNRTAIIQTSMGTITIELYEQRAPVTTANFIRLAKSGFYDGLIFHRVMDDFMIQTGDPTGTGTGGSSQTIELEIHPELTHVDGAVSMARKTDPDSASSQFFICDGDQTIIRPHLDGSYAVFGQVIEGMDVVRAIASVETHTVQVNIQGTIILQQNKPVEDVVITQITIE